MLRVEVQECFQVFILNAGEPEGNASTLEMAIKNYILQSIYLGAVFKLVYLQQSMRSNKNEWKCIKQTIYFMSPQHALKN